MISRAIRGIILIVHEDFRVPIRQCNRPWIETVAVAQQNTNILPYMLFHRPVRSKVLGFEWTSVVREYDCRITGQK